MPDQRHIVEHFVGQVLQAEARQEASDVAPVQHVELGEGLPAGAHLLHPRLIFSPPGVGESGPVETIPERLEDFFGFPGNRRAPVNHGSKYVEEQGSDTEGGGFYEH